MGFDATLTRAELRRIVDAVEPEWRLREATPSEAGHHAVYRLAVDTPGGDRTCYLKATPGGKEPSVDLEARLLAALDSRTEIPVPTVLGAVDEHDDLPAPFVLTEAMAGEARPRTDLASLPDGVLERIARATGRHLADLHALDAVDAFGFLTRDDPALRGGRPAGDLEAVVVGDPVDSWRDRLHDWAGGTLENLGETRFSDVAPAAAPALEARIDGVEGPFELALARIDQSLDNVLVGDGGMTALLDWEFTIAATPAYDLSCVAWSLAGGPYLFAPGVPDRRGLVREALVAGYRERGRGDVADRLRANRACYELLSALRSMVHLEGWYRQFDLGGRVDGAAAELRADVSDQL